MGFPILSPKRWTDHPGSSRRAFPRTFRGGLECKIPALDMGKDVSILSPIHQPATIMFFFRIVTRNKDLVFTAHVIHSLPLHMSAIHVLQNDQIVCTSHLIGLDQLPQDDSSHNNITVKCFNDTF